jgi:REP element-mobilizing transposase RayT
MAGILARNNVAVRARKKHVQLTLSDARKELGRGGWRRFAGRKKKPGAISHDTRPELRAQHPQHTTVRLVDGAPNLAREYLMKVIRKVIAESHKPGFSVVEFNVLGNHLHLINEAVSKDALARGMQGLEVRVTKRLNAVLGRRGKLFAHRYHSRSLRTPREVFNALRYVLLNRKHHGAEKKFGKYWVDPFSSAPWFTGWAEPISRHAPAPVASLMNTPAPTKPPTVWLLTTGWKQHGLLRFDDAPALAA